MRNAKYYERARKLAKKLADEAVDAPTRKLWANVCNFADRRLAQLLRPSTLILALLCGGCSGGFSASIGAGGSIHNPNHPDLAAVVRETPIISTSTGKSYQLPMVGGK